MHYLSSAPALAEASCRYDLDDCDSAWLGLLNGERALAGSGPVTEEQLERVLEELEVGYLQYRFFFASNLYNTKYSLIYA